MSKTQDKFDALVTKYVDEHGCTTGKMMSSPAIKINNKVSAFYWKDKMGFRLGKEFDMAANGINDFEYLSPFKNKPPMIPIAIGRYMIGEDYIEMWDGLTELAVAFTKTVK